jgi:hypothetical protein
VRELGEPKSGSKAAAKGAVSVGWGSPKKTVIYFPWAMKLAHFFYPETPVTGVFFEYSCPRPWLWRFSFLCLIRPIHTLFTLRLCCPQSALSMRDGVPRRQARD